MTALAEHPVPSPSAPGADAAPVEALTAEELLAAPTAELDLADLSGTELVLAQRRARREARRAAVLEAAAQRRADRLAAAEATGCGVCVHAATEGWWGPELRPYATHCRDCHRSYSTGGHCVSCCAHFGTQSAFDAHLNADGCMGSELSEVLRRDGKVRFRARDTAQGPVWHLAFYGERPDFSSFGKS